MNTNKQLSPQEKFEKALELAFKGSKGGDLVKEPDEFDDTYIGYKLSTTPDRTFARFNSEDNELYIDTKEGVLMIGEGSEKYCTPEEFASTLAAPDIKGLKRVIESAKSYGVTFDDNRLREAYNSISPVTKETREKLSIASMSLAPNNIEKVSSGAMALYALLSEKGETPPTEALEIAKRVREKVDIARMIAANEILARQLGLIEVPTIRQ